jgi:flagellar basal body-associated protein FliL
MSNTSKIVTAIIVIVLIIVGVVWYMGQSGSSVSNSNTAAATATAQPVAVAPAPLDTSDTSINSDLTTIDAQMNGLSADNTDTATLSAKQ